MSSSEPGSRPRSVVPRLSQSQLQLASRFSFSNVLDTLGLPRRVLIGISLGARTGRPERTRSEADLQPAPRLARPSLDEEAAEHSALSPPEDPPEAAGTVAEAGQQHRLADGFGGRFEREIASWVLTNSVFLVLLLCFGLAQHAEGLIWYVASSAVLVRSNDAVRAQAARKASLQILRLHAVTFCLALIAGTTVWVAKEHSNFWAMVKGRAPEPPTLGTCLFEALLVDVLARCVTTWLKVMVLCLHPCASTVQCRRRGALFTFLEYASLLARMILPTPVWNAYHGARPSLALRCVSNGLYLGMKLRVCWDRSRLVASAWRQWQQATAAFGEPASPEEVAEAGNSCPVCHDCMAAPLRLSCGHVYCDDCISEWFTRESTCPMCRAVVRPPGMQAYCDGSTSILPCVF